MHSIEVMHICTCTFSLFVRVFVWVGEMSFFLVCYTPCMYVFALRGRKGKGPENTRLLLVSFHAIHKSLSVSSRIGINIFLIK